MTREDLYEAALAALAAGAGGVDETLFGLPQKYSESVRKLKEDSPTAFGAGQVGSYFVPGTGIVGGARLGAKGIRALLGASKAVKGGKEAGLLAKILSSGAKAGTEGAVEGGGQVLTRRALGTGEGNAEEEAISGGLMGAGLGAASPALGKFAKNVYSHSAIKDRKSPKSRELIDTLMERGVWGGEDKFRDEAKKSMGKYEEILSSYREKLADHKVTFDDIVGAGEDSGSFAKREGQAKEFGRKGLAKQFEETRGAAKNTLGSDPEWRDVLEYLKGANSQLADLSSQKRAKAISGRGQREDAAIGSMKGSIDRLEKQLMGAEFGDEGSDAIDRARKEWGTGRELERSLDRWTPPENADFWKSLLKPAGALPTRTGVGLLLDKVAKKPGTVANKAARASEYVNRDEPAYRGKKDGSLEETETGKKAREESSRKNKIVKDGKRSGDLDELWKELE